MKWWPLGLSRLSVLSSDRTAKWCCSTVVVNTLVMSVTSLEHGRWMESEFETAICWSWLSILFYCPFLKKKKKKAQLRYWAQNSSAFLGSVWGVLIYSSFLTSFSFLLRFSPAQAELYEAVLEVQRSCLSLCSPGVSLDHIYSSMLALLGRQLMRLGIIEAATSDADALKVQKEKKRLNKRVLGRFTGSLITSWVHGKRKRKLYFI